MRRTHKYVLALGAAVLLMPHIGDATSATRLEVRLKGRVFSIGELNIKRNEPVVFVNDDTVPHNVMSSSNDNAFDLGSQGPGSETPVSFSIAGTVVVICAIHPHMHMPIKVAD